MTELVSDWRNSFSDGGVKVESENGIAFAFGVVQVLSTLEEKQNQV